MDDGCVIAEKGTGKAVVGEPIIAVSDIDFGTIRKGTKAPGKLLVVNEGDASLTITGYTIPKDPAVFNLKAWPVINAQNPGVLQPGGKLSLDIEITAEDTGK